VHGTGRAGPYRGRGRDLTGRPGADPPLQPGRGGRARRPGAGHPAGPPGHRPGAVGRLHAYPGRPRRHRGDRAAARRHPDRSGQAGAEGPRLPRDRQPPDAGGPPRRPGSDRPPQRRSQLRADAAVPRGGRRRGRHVRPRRRVDRGRRGPGRTGHRARGHPAGAGGGHRPRCGHARGVARPPGRPGRPGPAARSHRRKPVTATGSRIVSLGHYQPSRVLTNDDLAQVVDTSDEWIRSRVGIVERRVAGDETVADMAAAAAEKALAGSGLTAADIDLVAVATCSSVDRCPNVASRVAAKLGIQAPAAYDLNSACSGFSYTLATVDHAIRAGAARHALVIGSEKLTDFTDWTDRSTCVLFGDGAGAAVVSATSGDEPPGIGPVLWGSAPERGDVVVIEGWRPYIAQAGQTVFRWATTVLPDLARQVCEKAGISPADLAAFVPHQAN